MTASITNISKFTSDAGLLEQPSLTNISAQLSESSKKQVLNAEGFKQINNNKTILDTIIRYNFLLQFFLLLRCDRSRKVPCWTQNIVKEEQLKFKRDTHVHGDRGTGAITESRPWPGKQTQVRPQPVKLVNLALCPPSASHTETSELTVSQNKPSLQHQRFSPLTSLPFVPLLPPKPPLTSIRHLKGFLHLYRET